MRHVVRAVTEVDQGEPGELSLALADGLQVGEHLTGVELVGQRVDHRDPRDQRHRVHPLLREGPPHHRVDVPREDPRSVLDGLFAAQLHRASVDDDRLAAELGDTHLERKPRPGRVLLEDRRDRLALQRLRAVLVGLQLVGEIQHDLLFVGIEVVVAEEVPWHQWSSFVVESSAAGSAVRKPSACSVVRTSGGASRMVSGAIGLTR
jgi:hypothetical protein